MSAASRRVPRDGLPRYADATMITAPDIAARTAFVVHDLDQARAVLAAARETGRPVAAWSPPGAAAYWGAAYFAALADEAKASESGGDAVFVLDCGAEAGFVMAALRAGLRALYFGGDDDARLRLIEMAQRSGAALLDERPERVDLGAARDPAAAAREALSRCR